MTPDPDPHDNDWSSDNMHDPVKPGTDVAKDFQPGFSIVSGSINDFAPVSS